MIEMVLYGTLFLPLENYYIYCKVNILFVAISYSLWSVEEQFSTNRHKTEVTSSVMV